MTEPTIRLTLDVDIRVEHEDPLGDPTDWDYFPGYTALAVRDVRAQDLQVPEDQHEAIAQILKAQYADGPALDVNGLLVDETTRAIIQSHPSTRDVREPGPDPVHEADPVAAVIHSHEELQQLLWDNVNDELALSETQHVYALARVLEHEICDDRELSESDPDGAALRAAAATLRELVDDRDALMAARDWEISSEVYEITNGQPYPEREQVLRLIETLRSGSPGDRIIVDRDLTLAAVAWFHTTQNFVVHEHASKNRQDRYGFDSVSVRGALAQSALERLAELARDGVQITAADLEWAQQGLERLRGERPDSENPPPCMREKAPQDPTS